MTYTHTCGHTHNLESAYERNCAVLYLFSFFCFCCIYLPFIFIWRPVSVPLYTCEDQKTTTSRDSVQYVGPRNQTQVVRLKKKILLPIEQFSKPFAYFSDFKIPVLPISLQMSWFLFFNGRIKFQRAHTPCHLSWCFHSSTAMLFLFLVWWVIEIVVQ